MHETASTEWAAAASEARRMTGNRQTTSTFQRAKVGPEVQRPALKEKSTVPESQGGQIDDEPSALDERPWRGLALYRHLCVSSFMVFLT